MSEDNKNEVKPEAKLDKATPPTAYTTSSAAIIGKGTGIGYSTTSGGTYTALAEVKEISLPESTVGNVDATHYLSPANFVEKKSAIWQDVSDLSLTLNYTKATTSTLYGLVGVAAFYQIILPDGSTYAFPGFISKLGGKPVPNKDVITHGCSITVTGAVVFTAGA